MSTGLHGGGDFRVEQLRCDFVENDAGAMLLLAGEIDIGVAEVLDAALSELLDRAHSPARVDLANITFMDSTGIKQLVLARRRAPDGVEVVLVNPSQAVRRVLDITAVSSLFRIETT